MPAGAVAAAGSAHRSSRPTPPAAPPPSSRSASKGVRPAAPDSDPLQSAVSASHRLLASKYRCSTRGGRLPGSRRRQRSGRSGTGSLGEWEGKLESKNRRSTRAACRWKKPKRNGRGGDGGNKIGRDSQKNQTVAPTSRSTGQRNEGNPCANKGRNTHVLYSIPEKVLSLYLSTRTYTTCIYRMSKTESSYVT